MLGKVFHSGNPVMRNVRAVSIFSWRLSLLIAILWGCFHLGYESAFLLLVGLPWLAWSLINKRNGGLINHNTARSLIFHPLTWLVVCCSIIGMIFLVSKVDFWIAAAPVFLISCVGLFVITRTEFLIPGCYACFKEAPFMELKSCPKCSVEFEGGGWIGFKKHWKLNHQEIEPYDTVWRNMCAAHRKKGTPKD